MGELVTVVVVYARYGATRSGEGEQGRQSERTEGVTTVLYLGEAAIVIESPRYIC